MNTYATRANRAIDRQINAGRAPEWAPVQASEGWKRPMVRVAADTDAELRDAVRSALLHHLETRGVDWVLDVIAEAVTNHAVRRLDTDSESRMQEYNLLRGYADRIGRLPERAEELVNA